MEKARRKKAAALRYDPETDKAPEIVAAGYGEIADRIIASAEKHGIPVHQDAELASVLVGLNLNQEVPVELYRAVAAVLAVIMEADRQPQEVG